MTRQERTLIGAVLGFALLGLVVFGYHQRACLNSESSFSCDVARGFVRTMMPVRGERS